MNKNFNDMLKKFKETHNGNDELGMALIILALLLNTISMLIQITPILLLLQTVSLGILIYCITRFFSKEKAKRSAENYKFLNLNTSIKQYFRDQKYYMKESKTHKFFVCPECKNVCRVPKHKGKIKIKCPHCNHTFIKKT